MWVYVYIYIYIYIYIYRNRQLTITIARTEIIYAKPFSKLFAKPFAQGQASRGGVPRITCAIINAPGTYYDIFISVYIYIYNRYVYICMYM